MPHGVKIATCCYCGTRAALSLRGRDRHELSCTACGAPLHEMKRLRADRPDPRPERPPAKRPKPRKRKRRKPRWTRLIEEAADAIEDIFD
ncbi:hypothetical protein Ga0609869_000427 [Rhodovulum iodosum]|uniref:GATA-type domain-containing protein n=1 Tax=Rhodovulum iodosum TaxID=68291 RepID=A0ABV3XPD7_9RHOB|nr:hypothetical protein [Rhodovulum robiginosum]RSK38015.1 hypothetical protein EJA01_03555 [Rhodovulum robiginosum]